MIKPMKLCVGDTIGIVSPSAGVPELLSKRFENGVNALTELGYIVQIGVHSRKVTDWTAGSAQDRADDINAMFANPNIKAIMCTIGGNHANQVIPLLDYEMIAKHPKIFIGYSDITVLHFALYTQAALVTFYGPTLLAQFGEPFGVFPYTQEMFLKALTETSPLGKITPSNAWTDEFLDWSKQHDEKRPRVMRPNTGYVWAKQGKCEGILVGGCITSMIHLRGTDFWPDMHGKILFWEIPESNCDMSKGEALSSIDAHLADLDLSGVFDQISGMVVGRPKNYSQEDTQKLSDIILGYLASRSIPILLNVDIGHTDPMMTVPIGISAKLDSSTNLFELQEAAVTD